MTASHGLDTLQGSPLHCEGATLLPWLPWTLRASFVWWPCGLGVPREAWSHTLPFLLDPCVSVDNLESVVTSSLGLPLRVTTGGGMVQKH